jgi:hypothetical protein
MKDKIDSKPHVPRAVSGSDPTASQRNRRDRDERMSTENLRKNGLRLDDSENGYYYKPTEEGYALLYKSTLGTSDEKGFKV